MKSLEKHKNIFENIKKYCSGSRLPFFELAQKYLPKNPDSIVVDVGAGNGLFAEHLNLKDKYKNLYLLDGNKNTVDNLRKKFKNAVAYTAPSLLPFEENSVHLIHLSHIVEHLQPDDLHKFLQNLDRVLAKDGVLIISTPLLWDRFYEDLSHVKPYNPEVFIGYLCGEKSQASAENISRDYQIEELVFRYRSVPLGENIFSKYFIVYFLLKVFFIFLSKIGFRKYIKNGYTLILKKSAN